MLDIKVTKSSGRIRSVVYEHTDSEIAEEIAVTASVVTVLHTAMLGIMQVAGVALEFTDEPARIAFELPELDGETANKAEVILATMLCGLTDLAVTFSDFLNLEVD